MTTAESNNQAATVAEFRETLAGAVDDARKAGIPWGEVIDGLDEERFRALRKRDEEKEASSPTFLDQMDAARDQLIANGMNFKASDALKELHEEEEDL